MPKIPSEFLEQGVHDVVSATKHVKDIVTAVRNNGPVEIIADKMATAREMTHGEKYLLGKERLTAIDASKVKVERL
jgi:hypothetical protein